MTFGRAGYGCCIVQQGHHQLSTWGLLAAEQLRTIRDWIEQLVSQNFLVKAGEFNVLEVTPEGRRLLRGEVTPRLLRPAKSAKAGKAAAAAEVDSWEGVDRGLFDELRRLRQEHAAMQNVPAYIVFSDATLRDVARRRPSSLDGFRQIKGVGDKKLADYGQAFVARLVAYCQANQVPLDVSPPRASVPISPEPSAEAGPSLAAVRCFSLFRQGLSVPQVAQQLGRASSTVYGYLTDYIRQAKVTDPSPWVDAATAQRIAQAAQQVGTERLKPIFDLLQGQVAQVAHQYAVNVHNVNGVLAAFLTADAIVIGARADHHDIADFVFARPLNWVGVA